MCYHLLRGYGWAHRYRTRTTTLFNGVCAIKILVESDRRDDRPTALGLFYDPSSCAWKSCPIIAIRTVEFWTPRSTARTTDIAYSEADVCRDYRPTGVSWSVSDINDNDNEKKLTKTRRMAIANWTCVSWVAYAIGTIAVNVTWVEREFNAC